MKAKILLQTILMLAIAFAFSWSASALDDVEISVINAGKNVYMLKGAGGNIGLIATDDGLLLVDDQFAPLAKKIEAAMKSINDKPIKYVINTHYHGDHTGSNAHFSKHAPIFAHRNVRQRLQNNPKIQSKALPVVTYDNGVSIHLAQEEVKLTHLPNGHTDGDTIVYFSHANVLHTGDLFFEVGFPYVDLKGGGSVKGYLANVEYMINNFPDDVVIIPGHGKLTNKDTLKAYAKMLRYSIDRVSNALSAGKNEQQILEQGIGSQYQHMSWRFITEEKWLKTLIEDLK